MEKKRSRILESAIALAEQGGFENVRLRDVAAQSEVALGTLYKRFPSKESILIAALDLETEKLERRMARKPAEGATLIDRALAFFDIATRTLFKKPNLARAILRALTSGDAEVAGQIAAYHERTTRMIVTALRGGPVDRNGPSAVELTMAIVLQQIWFAALVGWMGGLVPRPMITEQLRMALTLMVRGADEARV